MTRFSPILLKLRIMLILLICLLIAMGISCVFRKARHLIHLCVISAFSAPLRLTCFPFPKPQRRRGRRDYAEKIVTGLRNSQLRSARKVPLQSDLLNVVITGFLNEGEELNEVVWKRKCYSNKVSNTYLDVSDSTNRVNSSWSTRRRVV